MTDQKKQGFIDWFNISVKNPGKTIAEIPISTEQSKKLKNTDYEIGALEGFEIGQLTDETCNEAEKHYEAWINWKPLNK
jgi:hypothetical protein